MALGKNKMKLYDATRKNKTTGPKSLLLLFFEQVEYNKNSHKHIHNMKLNTLGTHTIQYKVSNMQSGNSMFARKTRCSMNNEQVHNIITVLL